MTTITLDPTETASTETPNLIDVLREAQEVVLPFTFHFHTYAEATTGLVTIGEDPSFVRPSGDKRERLIDELMEWATDPGTFEPGAADRIRREAWGDAGA